MQDFPNYSSSKCSIKSSLLFDVSIDESLDFHRHASVWSCIHDPSSFILFSRLSRTGNLFHTRIVSPTKQLE